MSMLPSDPAILLSYVNLKLRDEFPDLDEMCDALDTDKAELLEILEKAGFHYDDENNCFR